jgi:uncharacterized protein YjbI with pentapeptide repeats
MPDPEQSQQPHKPEALKDQGCPVPMYGGKRCGRPVHAGSMGVDKEPVCMMHSRDPNKSIAAFEAEFERILAEAATGLADFSEFIFPEINLSYRQLNAMCWFAGVTFAQLADFSEAVFSQNAIFTHATFMRDAEFGLVLFEGGADFYHADFMQSVSFREAGFQNRAKFDEVVFNEAADFREAEFSEGASFRYVEFRADALLSGATFDGYADLAATKFAGRAEFDDAKFRGVLDLHDASFDGFVNFCLAECAQAAKFAGARFSGGSDFSLAEFCRIADFYRARFDGPAEFRETRFREDKGDEPGAVFVLTTFAKPKHVVFYKTHVGQALFHNCDVSELVFSNVRWRQRSNGKRMVLEESVRLADPPAGALWPEKGSLDERNYALIAELYQQLKKNYDDRRDYWTAGDFHYGEMEMKRRACPRLTWLAWLEAKLSGRPRFRKLGEWCGKLQSNAWLLRKVRWWHQRFGLAAWYRRASDYGESWGKPLLWLFAVLALFAALYPLLGLRPAAGKSPAAKTTSVQVQTPSPQETDLRYWNYERPGRLFCHSVMTSLGVAAFQRDLAYEPAYPWGRLLALLELLLTSTLIALFLLAVRRQFRR